MALGGAHYNQPAGLVCMAGSGGWRLCGEAAQNINGADMSMDGGWTAE